MPLTASISEEGEEDEKLVRFKRSMDDAAMEGEKKKKSMTFTNDSRRHTELPGVTNVSPRHQRLSFEMFSQARQPSIRPLPCVIISDPGEDLDDEMAMIMLRYLVSQDHLRCKGVVANLKPSDLRARLMRGTLDALGMPDVRVGVGTDGGSQNHKATFLETASSYMPDEFDERSKVGVGGWGLGAGNRLG